MLDATHDPNLRSFVDSANDPETDFPLQNLPFCTFRRDGGAPEVGVALGDRLVSLGALAAAGKLPGIVADFSGSLSTTLRALGLAGVRALRPVLQQLYRDVSSSREAAEAALVPAAECALELPISPRSYTDFYASIHHATTVGTMFRPDAPLLPNYKHVPIGYHGRASSVVVSGAPVRRPLGQTKADDAPAPSFGPSKMLDWELEVACVVGEGNALGQPVPIGDADGRTLGLVLLNDWSARDLQRWEYQPLGPFLATSFATTISPFVVTYDALAPFRTTRSVRPEGDPAPLPYLDDPRDRAEGAFDLTLEVWLSTEAMRQRGLPPARVSRGSFADMYWTFAQMLAHHTSNGCNLEPGDLLGSGTVSNLAPDARGCLLELTWDGPGKPRRPVTLPNGESRTFLQDGDEVVFRASASREGHRRIGFGECKGIILPAHTA